MFRVVARVVAFVVASGGVVSADQRDDARAEFTAGQAADKEGDWHNAIEHYQRAYDLAPHPFALYNIANDYQQLGQLREAARYYQRYLERAKDDAERARVGHVMADLRSRTSTLDVTSTPSGAKVVVDARQVGTTPYTGTLASGKHTITVSTRYDTRTQLVTPEYAEPVSVDVTLHAVGTLVVTGSPAGATVEVDGARIGVLPTATTIGSGPHHVVVTADGYQRFERDTEVAPVEPTKLEVDLDKQETPPETLTRAYLIAGLGGVDARDGSKSGVWELGIRTKQYQFAMGLAETDHALLINLLFRYALFRHPFSPYFGIGYSYVHTDDTSNTALGGTAELGVRYDIVRGERWTLSFRASVMATAYAGDVPMSGESEVRGLFPLVIGTELSYLTDKLNF